MGVSGGTSSSDSPREDRNEMEHGRRVFPQLVREMDFKHCPLLRRCGRQSFHPDVRGGRRPGSSSFSGFGLLIVLYCLVSATSVQGLNLGKCLQHIILFLLYILHIVLFLVIQPAYSFISYHKACTFYSFISCHTACI